MSSLISGSAKYPFLKLTRENRVEVSNTIIERFKSSNINLEENKKVLEEQLKSALRVIAGKKEEEELTVEEKKILMALNDDADKITTYGPTVKEWKRQIFSIDFLSSFLKKGNFIFFMGGIGPAGLGLFYLRSQKLIALANACVAIGLFVFGSTCLKLHNAMQQSIQIINDLNYYNVNECSQKMDYVYLELKKTDYLMRLYLGMHSKKMSPSHLGLQFLREQLDAMKYFFFNEGLDSTSKKIDFQEMRAFFKRFEVFCRNRIKETIGIGVVAVAWTYHTYMQRAYLMVIAGMMTFVAAMSISYELYALKRGSKKITFAREDQFLKEFQAMAKSSKLLKSFQNIDQAAQIQRAVIIPLDAILKLIPSWKESAADLK